MSLILEILGFFIIFMAIDYGRKDDSKIQFLSKQWFIIFLLVIIGTLLIRFGDKIHELKSKTHIEQQYDVKPSIQQTSIKI